MLQKTEGIVLRVLKYNDKSNIVHIYTASNGRASFLLPLAKSKKSVLRNVLFQPLSIIEFEADFKDNATIFKIVNAKSAFPFSSIPYDPFKISIALFLSEFLYRALKVENEDESLFGYLMTSIKWLDECRRGFSNFHLIFLLKLSKFLGLYPNDDSYKKGYYFDMTGSCFTADTPKTGFYLSVQESEVFHTILNSNYDTMDNLKLTREQRNRLLVIINDYYRLHVPDLPTLKSIDVLKEIFG